MVHHVGDHYRGEDNWQVMALAGTGPTTVSAVVQDEQNSWCVMLEGFVLSNDSGSGVIVQFNWGGGGVEFEVKISNNSVVTVSRAKLKGGRGEDLVITYGNADVAIWGRHVNR